jgi:formylglycine-generating enzyme required for sulfatase activity
MGSPDSDDDALEREKPQHEVAVSDFWISVYPITRKLYREILGTSGFGRLGDSLLGFSRPKGGASTFSVGGQTRSVRSVHLLVVAYGVAFS